MVSIEAIRFGKLWPAEHSRLPYSHGNAMSCVFLRWRDEKREIAEVLVFDIDGNRHISNATVLYEAGPEIKLYEVGPNAGYTNSFGPAVPAAWKELT